MISSYRKSLIKKELLKKPEGSLYLKTTRGHCNFYHYCNRKEVCINTNRPLVYKLARKHYLLLLIKNTNPNEISALLKQYSTAGLDIRRITLTPKQYKWVTEKYPCNTNWPEKLIYATASGLKVRSKSERSLADELDNYGVPYRYELTIKVNVSKLISGLIEYLKSLDSWHYSPSKLFYYQNRRCFWNVPDELQWMNSPGSVWKTYDCKSNTVTMNVDFAILLADGSLLIWEHAGLCLNPTYRCNTSEKIFILRESGYVPSDNLIFTVEKDILDPKAIQRIIKDVIIPRI